MKLNLIYYKNIIDLAFQDFVHLNEDFFSKCNGKYVLSKNFTKASLKKELLACIYEKMKSITVEGLAKNDIFVVIGSCYPKDNLVLDFKTESYFPKKLSNIMSLKPCLKWAMKEDDIEVDIDVVNEVLVEIFNEMFNGTCKMLKQLEHIHRSIIVVAHKRLDCYAMFKTIKWAYGNSNCCNIYKEKLSNRKQCLVALNDLVSKYVPNKIEMNRSIKFKRYAKEVKDYLDKKLGVER